MKLSRETWRLHLTELQLACGDAALQLHSSLLSFVSTQYVNILNKHTIHMKYYNKCSGHGGSQKVGWWMRIEGYE